MFAKGKDNEVHELIMEQIKDVENCVISFESFLRAASAPGSDFEAVRALCDGVYEKEATADVSLRRMIDSLGGTSFLPSTRENLISIASSCDRIANKCESTAQMVVYQQFRFPDEYAPDLLEIMSITHKQFDLLESSISQLFAKFGELLKDHSILDSIRAEESKIDVIEHKLYKKIFAMDLDLAHQMQLASYVEAICDLSDLIENIADQIQIILVTRKA